MVFGSEEEMFDALQDGTIGGVLVKEGVYECQLKNTGAQLLDVFGYTLPEQLVFDSNTEELNALFTKLLHIYEITHPAAWERWQEEGSRQAEKELLVRQEKKENILHIGLIGCVAGLVILFICLLLERKRRNA